MFHDAFCGRCFLSGVLPGHPGWRSVTNLGDLEVSIGAWWSGALGSVHARCARRRAGRQAIGWCFALGPGLAQAVWWGRLRHPRSACDWGRARACHLVYTKHAAAPPCTGLLVDDVTGGKTGSFPCALLRALVLFEMVRQCVLDVR